MSTIKERMEQAERLLFMEQEAHSMRHEIQKGILVELGRKYKVEPTKLRLIDGECPVSPTGGHIHQSVFMTRVGPCLVCGFKDETN